MQEKDFALTQTRKIGQALSSQKDELNQDLEFLMKQQAKQVSLLLESVANREETNLLETPLLKKVVFFFFFFKCMSVVFSPKMLIDFEVVH